MGNTIKANVFTVHISQRNIFLRDFESVLSELSKTLDNEPFNEMRVLDNNYHNVETSIWFDSFDNINKFSQEPIFNNAICFLLAKDMNFQLIEDKEAKTIKNSANHTNQKPKIPSHCIYLKDEKILLMEDSTNAPTSSTLHRGITSKVSSLKREDLKFYAKYRGNIIERLNLFVDTIKSIELIDINLEKYLKQDQDDGYLHNFISNPETKLTAKLQIESTDWRTRAVNFFISTLDNSATKELNNIKITYKDEHQKDDIANLYENLIHLKIEHEIYYEDISLLQNLDRLDYSKQIYKALLEAYHEQKKTF